MQMVIRWLRKQSIFKLQKIISKQDILRRIANKTECQKPTIKEPEINITLQILLLKNGRKKTSQNFTSLWKIYKWRSKKWSSFSSLKVWVLWEKKTVEWRLFVFFVLFFSLTLKIKTVYWENVKEKLSAGENVSWNKFKSFHHCSTHIDDFAIAMQYLIELIALSD